MTRHSVKKFLMIALLVAGCSEMGYGAAKKPLRLRGKKNTTPEATVEEKIEVRPSVRVHEQDETWSVAELHNDHAPITAKHEPPKQLSHSQYDSLVAEWYVRTTASVTPLDAFYSDFIDLEADSTTVWTSDVPDAVYEARLKGILSPIQLPYNDIIKRYLIVYTTTRKSTMERIMERAQYYFPLFEEELCKAGLPLELRMLPVVESALNPVAVSRAGATGLWQFMYATGKVYGLEVTSFVDQRRDPVASTRAACRFLGDLYKLYGDWMLALAAYNCGPGNVNKALRRAGTGAKTYWDIYEYLPRETRGYIPSFIAATYAYTYHRQHGIEPGTCHLPQATDTVMVSKLMHFEQVSSTIDVPVEMIRALNPQYKMDIVPALDRSHPLTLPVTEVPKFLDAETEILAKDSIYLATYLNPANIDSTKITAASAPTQTYRVKSGDTLGAIAKRHGVTVSQLVKWNNLKSANSTLRIGQRIEILR